MGTVESTNAPTYHRASEEDVLIRAHIAEAGGSGDEPLVDGTTLTVAAVWQTFQRVRGDRRGFRARTPGLTEDQRMAVVRFVGKYPHYVLPPVQSE